MAPMNENEISIISHLNREKYPIELSFSYDEGRVSDNDHNHGRRSRERNFSHSCVQQKIFHTAVSIQEKIGDVINSFIRLSVM